MSTTTPRFGALLRRYRLAAGLTQEGLAERAGLSARAVSDLERDAARLPRLDSLALLGDALELDAAERAMLRAAARPFADAPDDAPHRGVSRTLTRGALPMPLSSLVGRERELAELAALLDHTCRLVTLTGPAGSGKTRLALEAARRAAINFPDGVRLVELGAVADAARVSAAVAAALGVLESPSEPLTETLVRRLGSRRLLLVLDNCEHLIEACAELCVDLLEACAGLQVLATSREALGLPGEHAWAVPPLAPPVESAGLTTIAASEAVQLFVERAQAATPGFRLTADNAAAVGEICRRLDGLPLALELAAARVRVLALDEIVERLGDRFALLTTSGRGVPARQRSLLAAVEWSYELLPEDERRLLRRLSVCVGGFDLAAAEALDYPAAPTLDRLSRLIDKSLVVPHQIADGSMRYGLLVTLRAYGRARLVEASEAMDASERHLDHFLSVASTVAEELWGGRGHLRALGMLDGDHDNLRAALAWAVEQRRSEALQLAADVMPFWRLRKHHSEGRRWLAAALAHAPVDAAARGRALAVAATLAYDQGDNEATLALSTEAIDRCRASGDTLGLGLALHRLSTVPAVNGARRDALLLEALALFEAADFAWGIGSALSSMGNWAGARGDLARGEELLARSLAVHRSLGDDLGTAAVLFHLSSRAEARGDTDGARALLDESMETALPYGLGASQLTMFAVVRLADLASSEGRLDEARRMLRNAIADVRDSGYHLADVVHWSGVVELRRGDRERGVRLIAAAAAPWGSLGSSTNAAKLMYRVRLAHSYYDWGWEAPYQASLAEARAALPPEDFAQAWADGEQMGLEQAADLILANELQPGPQADEDQVRSLARRGNIPTSPRE